MGTKEQRQNQHVKRLEHKMRKFQKAGRCTKGLTKELGYMMGEPREAHKTGRDADPRLKKSWQD